MSPEPDTTGAPSAAPVNRRRLILVIAGSVAIILVLVGSLTAVITHEFAGPPHITRASTDQPATAKPSPTPTSPRSAIAVPTPSATVAVATPSPLPTPKPTVTHPPAAAPAAPAAPVTPSPSPTVGPSVQITSFTGGATFQCSSTTSTHLFRVTIAWSSSGGNAWQLSDTAGNVTNSDLGDASGSITVRQSCSANGGSDVYTLTVSTNDPSYSTKTASTSMTVAATYAPTP
jgi:hypothetical protein